ncbi:uncharacterized protein RCC_10830 [Ramularia collo-cygni]|uniref:Tafazzin n=1 Tax=Ramularia collo-cygni TaxID=112498 RepID=A0A2D3VKM2_9PEZI|nr:uncharacterized protein RCC_10830 [Ramularia collo-cygni]CZT25101.1 uncharacterized protein RCC_10830 [Ramularia collo-cygni]
MPKKRHFSNLKQFQGESSGKPARDGNKDAGPSVNERLNELRKIEGKDAVRKKRELAESTSHQAKPKQLLRFARLAGLEPREPDSPPTLLHLALKTAASHWELFDVEDLPELAAELPLPLRLRLLSYLGYYGPPIDMMVLQALVGGSEPMKSLDLAGLVGHGKLTLNRLVKFTKHQAAEQSPQNSPVVVDSWDQDVTFEAALTMGPSISRFSQLTHISLSHPPTGTSWRDLLSLAKHTPSITHLSLAYWSRPTLTPNLATTTVSSQHSPDVTAGGSHYYSALDQDLTEPASILRQLSASLLYLQWLDLEGCTEWIPALAFHADIIEPEPTSASEDTTSDPWSRRIATPSLFISTWKNVTTLLVGQGWLPTVPGLKALPRQTMTAYKSRCLEDYLKSFDPLELRKAELDEADIFGVEKRQADVWLEIEERAIAAERRINAIRRVQACKPIVFDHGWERKVFW